MIKKILFQYRVNIMAITVLVLFTTLFPYFVTITNLEKADVRIFKPEMSGKTVIISNGSEKMEMDVELFIPLVLYSVMPEGYEEETMKAMVVIIRTYIIHKMDGNETINAETLGLPYTTYVELEKKWGTEYEETYNYTMKLIENTNHQIICYEGNAIYPYYHEISAGVTNAGEYGYLKSVESREDMQAEGYLSVLYFTTDNITQKIKENLNIDLSGKNPAEEIKLNMEENGEYVRSVSVGETVVGAEDWQKMFELPSTAFTFEAFSDGYKMVAKGKGCGKGLSIYGAEQMADDGKSYKEILQYYFSDVEVQKEGEYK
ncbi:MAG: SpoIID/LytB domain-containing protein [Lachnospiraceae bacterium]|nr:SpoIID/LytB domain-containing protein [Lachnospiraceae bacterium]